MNPIALAIASGYTFVSRGYTLWIDHLKELLKKAIQHKGTALLDVLQPCVTYNDIYTADFYKERLYNLEEDPNWDPVVSSGGKEKVEEKIAKAWAKSLEWDSRIPVGIFYVNPYSDTFEERIAERNPLYTLNPPNRQAIARDKGEPIICLEVFGKLFMNYIIQVGGAWKF